MDVSEQIAKFQEFFETHYLSEILENMNKQDYFIVIDFFLLSKFCIELADDLLDSPAEVIKAGEMALETMNLSEEKKQLKLRISNLPKSQIVKIRNLRSDHLNRILLVEGLVRQKSSVRPQVTSARFECPSCGNIITVLQLEKNFKEPTSCGCGRKGKFRLTSKEMVDAQGITLEEAPEDMEGGEQPKRINIFLKDDLVNPLSDKKTNPGTKLKICGILKEVPIIENGNRLTRFDLVIEANNFETVQEDFTNISITDEEIEQIKDLSKRSDITRVAVESFAPSIYGYEMVKEALLLQLLGGVKREGKDGSRTRGDIHVLLIGDPGAGKSQLLKRTSKVSPKARFVSGKGASGAGLTASVVKDEFLNGWSLEAGALVLGNNGFCMIDELDKMTKEDRSAMHEALEQQTVSISKANIQATLRCETTVLAAANPKFGRFDPYMMIAKQIDLPSSLINRFDLIFPIRDLPNKDKDRKLASFILKLHKNKEAEEAEIETEMLKKYIAYARQNVKPILTQEAIEEIVDYYVRMRNSGSADDGGVKPIPISARQLEALVRLSEASAKLKLSEKATKKDAKRAIALLQYCLSQVGVDPDTGKIDIDRITTSIPASERNTIVTVKQIIDELEKVEGKTISADSILAAGKDKGMNEDKIEETIQKLKRAGDIFEPKPGYFSKL